MNTEKIQDYVQKHNPDYDILVREEEEGNVVVFFQVKDSKAYCYLDFSIEEDYMSVQFLDVDWTGDAVGTSFYYVDSKELKEDLIAEVSAYFFDVIDDPNFDWNAPYCPISGHSIKLCLSKDGLAVVKGKMTIAQFDAIMYEKEQERKRQEELREQYNRESIRRSKIVEDYFKQCEIEKAKSQEAFDKYVKEWEAAHPDIDVDNDLPF